MIAFATELVNRGSPRPMKQTTLTHPLAIAAVAAYPSPEAALADVPAMLTEGERMAADARTDPHDAATFRAANRQLAAWAAQRRQASTGRPFHFTDREVSRAT